MGYTEEILSYAHNHTDVPYDLEGFVKEVVEWQNEQPSLKSVLDIILQMAIEYVEE